MAIVQRLRKSGDSYVVTISDEVVEEHGWHEGQLLSIDLAAVETSPTMSPEVREAFERAFEVALPALRYLADR